MMRFEEAFGKHIKGQKVSGCGFDLLHKVKQSDGFYRELGGYFTVFENGYRLMFCGQSLGETHVQEVLLLNPDNEVLARDTDDLRWPINTGLDD